jgi:hypothetical protein
VAEEISTNKMKPSALHGDNRKITLKNLKKPARPLYPSQAQKYANANLFQNLSRTESF